jgi:poly [ADP-ribose] polymerase 2/3/4
MTAAQVIPPPTGPVRLIQVRPTELEKGKGTNKFYNMTPDGAEFIAEWGRVGHEPDTKRYPISKWEKTYKEKVFRKDQPYKDVTHLAAVKRRASGLQKIANTKVDDLFTRLLGYSKTSVAQNYTITSDQVTEAQVKEAQSFLEALTKFAKKGTGKAEVNKLLLDLYMVIPRRMGNVNHFLLASDIKTQDDLDRIRSIIDSEQKTLDVMAGQVQMAVNDVPDDGTAPAKTILDVLGIVVDVGTDKDEQIARKMMGPDAGELRAVYTVSHNLTQSKFQQHLAGAGNKKTELLWHGSRNENWISILQSGLKIRPTGAILTGSMFGDGIYAADKYRKSAGYTSLAGSYWVRGQESTAFLALMNLHVGNQYVVTRSDSSLSKKKLDSLGNYDSTFAKGGIDLINNEYIVYTEQQSTIAYLVQVGK